MTDLDVHSDAGDPDRPLIVLSNREPYEHVRSASGTDVRSPAGGLVSALDPILRRISGTWVAWGSGSADRATADRDGRVMVPPADPRYTLRRVWLSEQDVKGYYLGFANSALWPLCHLFIPHLDIRRMHWERYRAVNGLFSDAVVEEAQRFDEPPMIWVQDYHFALAPAMIRTRVPGALIHQFWHIPFPPADVFRIMPLGVHDALLRGLLGNDLLEFQTAGYARNFLECVERALPEASVDYDAGTVELEERTVRVGAFPISIDVHEWERLAGLDRTIDVAKGLRERYAQDGRQLVVSVDRMDYTKGLPRRLRALETIWRTQPERRGTFTMLFVAPPSRSDLAPYAQLERDVLRRVAALNARYGTDGWTPVVLIHGNVDADLLAAVYRAADACIVSSLQDGMNLVAKEFIACQQDRSGVLVLSRFTGAADELEGALLVNPFFIDSFADAIVTALDMPPGERESRMQALHTQLRGATIDDWLHAIMVAAEEAVPRHVAGVALDATALR